MDRFEGIFYGSDLHIDIGGLPKMPPRDAKILLIAGDTANSVKGEEKFYKRISKERPELIILSIPGNHTGYSGDPVDLHREKFCAPATRDYPSIVGCTLWTDFQLYGDAEASMELASQCMNDYYRCIYNNQRLRPQDTVEIHKQHLQWLRDHPAEIVITHHAPSPKSISGMYGDSDLNPAYCSNLEPLIQELKPKFWIHGHCHNEIEYQIDNTRVLCNPRGYPGEPCFRNWNWKELPA